MHLRAIKMLRELFLKAGHLTLSTNKSILWPPLPATYPIYVSKCRLPRKVTTFRHILVLTIKWYLVLPQRERLNTRPRLVQKTWCWFCFVLIHKKWFLILFVSMAPILKPHVISICKDVPPEQVSVDKLVFMKFC